MPDELCRPYADKPQYSGNDNSGKPRTEYLNKIAGLDDNSLFQETKRKIWGSSFANNNPKSDYHWQCDICYDELNHRNKPEEYEKAYMAVSNNAR